MGKLTVEEIEFILLCIEKLLTKELCTNTVAEVQVKLQRLAETQRFMNHHTEEIKETIDFLRNSKATESKPTKPKSKKVKK